MDLFKKRFHPCGGFWLQGAMKWLVPANVLMLFVGLTMLAYDVYSVWDRWMEERVSNTKDFYVRFGLWSGYVVHVVVAMPMDFYLHRATKTKNPHRLKIWIVFNFFNTIWATVDYWVHTFYFGLHIPTLTPYNFYCVYRFYMCVVVYYFCLEIQEEKEIQAAARYLTDQEVYEFEEGLELRNGMDLETKSLIDKIQYERYKRDQFEIDVNRLEIDYETPLGSGAYGVVYRGLYNAKEEETKIPVAIKTFESSLLDAHCFKALLSELKVMTCMGQHENIIKLVGAVTSGIKKRSLQIVLEFCPYGSLLEFLRASRGLYVSLIRDGEIAKAAQASDKPENGEYIFTTDLLKWAFEIANDMTYLEDKKVIHGDLAARNLLLTETKQIKIGDFGLARQLYQYSVYVKRQNAPLPWRWIALEALTLMNFSSKSDVWSFGIVLHELFTLGEIPYQVKQFNLEFVDSLRNGMRLEQSALCPNVIFNLMEQCWLEAPEKRPSFQDLRENLNIILNEQLHK